MLTKDRWPEFFCLASGPSLTPEQIATVKAWRNEKPGRAVLVVNTTWLEAPWADVLFAMDGRWWNHHKPEFDGHKFTCGYGITSAERVPLCRYGNSGSGALILARMLGARWIGLLGYDCKQGTNGETHHHGDHPPELSNAVKMENWPAQFATAARQLRNVQVVNFTPGTALQCFPTMELDQCLMA